MAVRIVIVGGGFGGAYTARHLERYLPAGAAEVTLVSRDNYYLMTPLLFEAGSGGLEFRHAVNPVRPLLRAARFVNATVDRIDLAGRTVHAASAAGDRRERPYDHLVLVLALGQRTDTGRIPGSEHALPFKTVADAIAFWSRVIEAFERAVDAGFGRRSWRNPNLPCNTCCPSSACANVPPVWNAVVGANAFKVARERARRPRLASRPRGGLEHHRILQQDCPSTASARNLPLSAPRSDRDEKARGGIQHVGSAGVAGRRSVSDRRVSTERFAG